MTDNLPKKELIFFTPGRSDFIYSCPANHHISEKQLLKVQKRLVQKISNPVVYIEDRRANNRRQRVVQDFLSHLGRGE